MYSLFFIPLSYPTKFLSFLEYQKETNGKTKAYLKALLTHYSNGLSCRQISFFSGIEIQSLTYPLNELLRDKIIHIGDIKKDEKTGRFVRIYKLK